MRRDLVYPPVITTKPGAPQAVTPSVLNRRHFLRSSLALASTFELQRAARALGLTAAPEVCHLQAEQEVGPYYIAGELLRANVREDRPGLPLELRLIVLDSRTCRPMPQAAVEIWQCDALGLYSGFTKMNPRGPGGPGGLHHGHDFDGPPPPDFDPEHPGNRPGPPGSMGAPPLNPPTDKLTFLRGIQLTDGAGSVHFQTIIPGFYQGRTNHIHFKVRLGGEAGKSYTGGHIAHTGQVFFPEELAAELMHHEPYANHHIHRTTQAEDHVFTEQDGALAIARVTPLKPETPAAGYRAELVAAVDPTATPAPIRMGPGGPAGPPPRS